jgi:hypothetical protein
VDAADLEDLQTFCALHGVVAVLGYCRNGERFALDARAKVQELLGAMQREAPSDVESAQEAAPSIVIELQHFNTFPRVRHDLKAQLPCDAFWGVWRDA